MPVEINAPTFNAPGAVFDASGSLTSPSGYFGLSLSSAGGLDATFDNFGRVTVHVAGISSSTFAIGIDYALADGESFHNEAGGTVDVWGEGGIWGAAVGDGLFQNDGLLQVVSATSFAIGVSVSQYQSATTFRNAGTIKVVGATGPVEGIGILQGDVVNSGTIDVTGPAVWTSGVQTGFTQFTNTGTISVHATGGQGVQIWHDIQIADLTVTNSGTITADYAVKEADIEPGKTTTIDNSGTLAGLVQLNVEADRVINTGLITGALSLLDGNDLYDGRGGRIGGAVDAGAGDDTLYGGADSERLYGGSGNDLIVGGAGNDTISGDGGASRGAGNDTLTGGAGRDVFQVFGDAGNSVITDFTHGQDRIELDFNGALHNLADVLRSSVQSGADTLITLGAGETLRLQGVAKASLTVSDFTFAFPTTPGDFSGDGKADFLVNTPDGTLQLYRSGTGLNFAPTVIVPMPTPGSQLQLARHAQDFNGDGISDLLFRAPDGSLQAWLMNADGSHATLSLPKAAANMHLVAAGDLNGDGKPDLVWQTDSGGLVVWKDPAGNSLVSKGLGAPDPGMRLQGVADFNGDGQADLLFVSDAGAAQVWQSGASFTFSKLAAGTIASGWHVQALGDFNGDGKADILWRSNTGALSLWLGSATGGSFTHVDAGSIGSNWTVQQVADFNGDGRADILFEDNTGRTQFWISQATPGVFAHGSGPVLPTDWHLT